ncbi:Uncharacterised protein [Mycobacteroides abscessus subsp. abscessus]|jgi:hypothetical protein|uniref:hypothetical protein n=1 Tax=Mycobacteroides abscessus TaxID=36809 RepID=UPI00092C6996|nr:hypothetical protein [Mycobacteroides abscessus]SIH23882.1 Uncharacterised protein [Mycobacteroides abscessus subsp. abscessus]
MCPPPAPKTLTEILIEACTELALERPELFWPQRYYNRDDYLDWAGTPADAPLPAYKQAS